MPRRKPHPADAANLEIASRAAHFEILLFVNRAYVRDSATNLDEAREKAAALLGRHPTMRRPMIYAIDPQGRRAIVPLTAPT